MKDEKIIEQFADRHAPVERFQTGIQVRHNITSLSRYLNTSPDEVTQLCEAGLIQAEEPYAGCPSLRFCASQLSSLRRELAMQHASDTIELARGNDPRQVSQILDLSWSKRREKVIELSRKS